MKTPEEKRLAQYEYGKQWRKTNAATLKIKKAAYAKAHKKEISLRDRAKYLANPEKARARSKERYAKYRERIAAYTKQYREKNRDKLRVGTQRRFDADPEKIRAARRASYRKHRNSVKVHARQKKYGLTTEAFGVLLGKQEGLCAICAHLLDSSKDTHIDHDHKTGATRGLLCHRCNLSIGHLRDNSGICHAAAIYLELWDRR